jgi:polyhydroxyalkanoate synthesis repressor PhaR
MAQSTEPKQDTAPTVIKKYANRRLYNTQTSVYVTLEDLAEMVRRGENFTVSDAKSGEDITRSVLTQIIFELENKGENLLPISFLRQLIQFYGDSMQSFVPNFLDMSLQSFVQQKDNFSQQMGKAFGLPLTAFESQIKQNMNLFEQAFGMFVPFAQNKNQAKPKTESNEMENLRSQLSSMQEQLDKLLKQKT